MRKLWCLSLTICALVLSSCGSAPQEITSSEATTTPARETPTNAATYVPPPGDRELVLWVAPAFAPDETSPAGILLQERLNAFETSNPGVVIEVRIKAESGAGGLYQSLEAASNAAPSVLPDIISLDPGALRASVHNELIVPLEELFEAPSSPAWYDYAVTTSRIDGSFYGHPFVSETEVLAYRTFLFSTPPRTWSEILTGTTPFLFPAGDPQARFTLLQYIALGGTLVGDAGEPSLDPIVLTEVLEFYSAAQGSGALPISSRQYTSAAETWDALVSERATSAIAPLSDFFLESDSRVYSAVPIPSQTEQAIGFSETWSWAIVTQDPNQQELAARLIEWLGKPEFLGPWTYALGMLPPTANALMQWPEGPETSLANSLVTVVRPYPSVATLEIFGPPIHGAVEAVIRDESTPSNAALTASQTIAGELLE